VKTGCLVRRYRPDGSSFRATSGPLSLSQNTPTHLPIGVLSPYAVYMIKKSRPTNDQQHPPDRFLSTFVFTFILFALVLLLNIQRHVIVAPAIHSSGKYGPHFLTYEVGMRGWPFRWTQEELLARLRLRPSGCSLCIREMSGGSDHTGKACFPVC